ncbi:hypothetical protein [Hymenobacter siberiensis]|uniref:hypothetical protein n=1 Tax=Hymenobacter siberiensis TaxID=2848396 RepID=UPI001C1E42DE|nr:hypothetical protein [Hymenobacter siberiensis]
MATDAIKPLSALALFKVALYEIHKVESASFDLEEFNHFVNRAQLEYANKRYNLYEATQQLTDDLRAIAREFEYRSTSTPALNAASETMPLPEDYFHALRAKVSFTANTAFGPFRVGDVVEKTAKRMTADAQGFAESPNYYVRPSYTRPYWRILQNTLAIKSGRHANLDLDNVELEYLRTPKEVTLYQSDVDDLTQDTSMLLDWPAYVCNELAKVLVTLFLENTQNARLNTYPLVGQSIPSQLGSNSAMPATAQQQPAQAE